ncbi:hypothetical protein [Promicromonospora sp. NPDC050880]|uniref:hypothetical protein n=1 Tax=Promicromonospora sp. NPDC050880 TaxID=3364406 RepID=UPI0037983969
MNPTRHPRPLLAAPRREITGVLAVMAFVLTVLGVQVLCGIHPDAGHAHPAASVAHHATSSQPVMSSQQATSAHHATPAQDPTAAQHTRAHHAPPAAHHGTTPGHHGHGHDPSDCAEDRPTSARYERTASLALDVTAATNPAPRWLLPAPAPHQARATGYAVLSAAPSLHALGISRT